MSSIRKSFSHLGVRNYVLDDFERYWKPLLLGSSEEDQYGHGKQKQCIYGDRLLSETLRLRCAVGDRYLTKNLLNDGVHSDRLATKNLPDILHKQ